VGDRTLESPWLGLAPYTEDTRAYFHGREREKRIVAANLRARRLTVLYGSSGIGKSSLLQAGVVPTLGEKRAVLLFKQWQDHEFLEALKQRCSELAAREGKQLDPDQPLDELLAATARAWGAPVLVVFDQFEEYFVAHAAAMNGDGFEPELARAVNRSDVDATFLISLREDALAGMDRFQLRIPNLLGNLIRLEHLTTAAAEQAIRESLDEWNREHDAAAEIDDDLLKELLPDVNPQARGSLVTGEAGARIDAIDAPLLQLVLARLWDVERERGHGTPVLRLATYRELGRAEGIVASHFAAILGALTEPQRELCARFFDRLVTPSGGKIAYPLEDLAKLAGDLSPQVKPTLEALEKARILQEVGPPGNKAVEIYHDVLAPTILDWQAQIVRERRRAEERRRLRRRLIRIGLIGLVILAVAGYIAYTSWRAARPWATVADLGSGQVFQLKGAQDVIGRSVPNQPADVSFPDTYVSRVHLIVYKDGRSIDPRSTNGTTVDGRFLRYGLGWRELKPGDVLVLGGAVVLRYERISYPFWQLWTPSASRRSPAPGWALLVTGRDVTPLVGPTQYLRSSNGEVVASMSPRGALAAARQQNGSLVITDIPDGAPTDAQCPQSNGESYPLYRIRDGDTRDVPTNCVLIVRGTRAQIVVG
jgi:hypothetical protein